MTNPDAPDRPDALLPTTTRACASEQTQHILAEVRGVTAVVVATPDGFDIASAMRQGEAARIAAMASSIAAISAVVSEEAELGQSKSVTIDTDSGFALVCSVRRPDLDLIIIIIANGEAILGQVNYSAAQFAQALAAS